MTFAVCFANGIFKDPEIEKASSFWIVGIMDKSMILYSHPIFHYDSESLSLVGVILFWSVMIQLYLRNSKLEW